MTPGFQFLGNGYDVFNGNIYDTTGNGDGGYREPVFSFTNKEGKKTPDGKWLVPDKTSAILLSACSIDQSQTVMNSAYDYQQSVATGIGINFEAFGAAFQFSVESKHISQTTDTQQSIYAQLESTCAVYQLAMNVYDPPVVSSDFLEGAKSLPLSYDEDAYMTFIQVFGTHYIRQLKLGGRWGWLIEFSMKDFQSMLDDQVNFNLGLSYAGRIKAGLNINSTTDENTTTRVMNSISHNFSYNIGGDYQPDALAWQQSVRGNPMPIRLDLTPLYELFKERYLSDVANISEKAVLLKQAIVSYCDWLKRNNDPNVNCSRPEPKPRPQPRSLAKDAIHRICVENNGAFGMWFVLFNQDHPNFSSESSFYPQNQKRCLDGMQIQASDGDKLSCKVNVSGGSKNVPCQGGNHQYDSRSTLQANYICWGSSTLVTCQFKGFSEMT
jgi:hypothetical protein